MHEHKRNQVASAVNALLGARLAHSLTGRSPGSSRKTTGEDVSQAVDDRRKRARKEAYSAGLAVSRDGAIKLDCRVEDLTAAGVKVSVAGDVPERLYLLVAGKEVAYEAIVVWSRSRQHGLKITNTHPIHGLRDTPLRFLRNLKLERLRG